MNSNNHSPQYIELMDAIVSYKKEMFDWWDSLQRTRVGEWTLLLTLACWGVPDMHCRISYRSRIFYRKIYRNSRKKQLYNKN